MRKRFCQVSIAFRLLKRLVGAVELLILAELARVSIAFRLLKRLVDRGVTGAVHQGAGGLNCLSAVEAIGSLPYFRPFG